MYAMSSVTGTTKGAFWPNECIKATAQTYEYQTAAGVAGAWTNLPPAYAEQQFLPDEVTIHNVGYFSLAAISRALPFSLLDVPPTEQALSSLYDESAADLQLFGRRVETDVRAMEPAHPGLVSQISLGEVERRLNRLGGIAGMRRAGNFLWLLRADGHFILPATTTHTLPTQLIIPPNETAASPQPDGSPARSDTMFPAINLDELEQLQPGTIGRRLVEWHMARAHADFARQALRNLSFHQLPLEKFVPRFLMQLASLDDYERQTEISQCQAILGRIATLGSAEPLPYYRNLVGDFFSTHGTLVRGIDSGPDGVHAGDALEHLAGCPGSNASQNTQASIIANTRQQFLDAAPPERERLSPNDTLVVVRPWLYFGQNFRPEVLKLFLQKHRLSITDFAPLANVTNITPNRQTGHRQEPPSFSLLANMIILAKQGRANLSSLAQRAFIADLHRAQPIHPDALRRIGVFWQQIDARVKPGPSDGQA